MNNESMMYNPKWDYEYKYDYSYNPDPLINLLNNLIKNNIAFYFKRSEIKSKMEAFKIKLIISEQYNASIEFIIGEKGEIILNYNINNSILGEDKNDKIILSTDKFNQKLLNEMFRKNLGESKFIAKLKDDKLIMNEISGLLRLLKIMYEEKYTFKSCSDCKDNLSVFYICKNECPIILVTKNKDNSYLLSLESDSFNKYYLRNTIFKYNSINTIVKTNLFLDNAENMELPF